MNVSITNATQVDYLVRLNFQAVDSLEKHIQDQLNRVLAKDIPPHRAEVVLFFNTHHAAVGPVKLARFIIGTLPVDADAAVRNILLDEIVSKEGLTRPDAYRKIRRIVPLNRR